MKTPDLTPEVAFERLQVWYQLQQQLAEIKTAEVLARKELAAFYFRQPEEGVNRLDLGGGFNLKMDFGYDYKIDEAALSNVRASDVKRLKLNLDDLIAYKPTLVLRQFRALNDAQREFVLEFLDVKEKSPQLHIVPVDKPDPVPTEDAADAVNDVAVKPPRARKTARKSTRRAK